MSGSFSGSQGAISIAVLLCSVPNNPVAAVVSSGWMYTSSLVSLLQFLSSVEAYAV